MISRRAYLQKPRTHACNYLSCLCGRGACRNERRSRAEPPRVQGLQQPLSSSGPSPFRCASLRTPRSPTRVRRGEAVRTADEAEGAHLTMFSDAPRECGIGGMATVITLDATRSLSGLVSPSTTDPRTTTTPSRVAGRSGGLESPRPRRPDAPGTHRRLRPPCNGIVPRTRSQITQLKNRAGSGSREVSRACHASRSRADDAQAMPE